MKINWKIRLQNPKFWLQVGLSIFTPILTYYGVKSDDLTTWGQVFALLFEAASNPQVLLIVAMSMWNSIQDPTVATLGDSQTVLQAVYIKPEKVKKNKTKTSE